MSEKWALFILWLVFVIFSGDILLGTAALAMVFVVIGLWKAFTEEPSLFDPGYPMPYPCPLHPDETITIAMGVIDDECPECTWKEQVVVQRMIDEDDRMGNIYGEMRHALEEQGFWDHKEPHEIMFGEDRFRGEDREDVEETEEIDLSDIPDTFEQYEEREGEDDELPSSR